MNNQEINYNGSCIDEDFWKSKDWEMFYMSHTDIMEKIIEVFKDNKYEYVTYIRLSSNEISDKLGVNNKYIHHMLTVWYNHYCTFYKQYGRIMYDKSSGAWDYYNKNTVNPWI